MISSSGMRRIAASVGTVPSRVFAARSRRALVLDAERPQARSLSSGVSISCFGRGVELAESSEQALENRGGGFAVELLIDDGLKQRLEGRVLALEFQREGAGAAHELAEFGIDRGEGAAGQGGIVANGAASIDHERQGIAFRG